MFAAILLQSDIRGEPPEDWLIKVEGPQLFIEFLAISVIVGATGWGAAEAAAAIAATIALT